MHPSRHAHVWRPVLLLLGAALLAGCGKDGGRRSGQGDLSFERLADTTGLSAGAPIVEGFDAYRMDSGALRLTGRSRLPDSTRLRIAIRRPGSRTTLAMLQVVLLAGTFDTPPVIGAREPLPRDRYEFVITAQFTPEWQPASVLRRTDMGRALRGPGITRTQLGGAMLYLVEEMTR